MTPDVQHLSSLLAAIPNGVEEINLDGVITYSNPRHHEMLGYAPGELIGMTIFDLIYDASEKTKVKNYLNLLVSEQPKPSSYITISRRKDGTPVDTQIDWACLRDANGKLTGFVSLITDITEQHTLQDKLRKERDLAQHYLDVAQFMIVVLNRDGNISLVNRKACDVLGNSADQLLNQNWFELCLPESEREAVSQYFHKLMNSEIKPVKFYQNSIITSGGEERLIDWHNTLQHDADGSICGTISSGEDVTENVLAQKEHTKLFDQIRKAQKMEALARLTNGIAHDFNNILASILGYADLTLDSLYEMGDQDELVRYIGEVIGEGEKARDLIAQMLAFARINVSANNDIALNPAPLIKELGKATQTSLPDNIELSINTDPEPPKILIDPAQLHQAILNLFDNARDALEKKGGHINLNITKVNINQSTCLSCHKTFEGDFVELAIADDGEGIEESMLNNIFEPFYGGHENNVSIGLSGVHAIVHDHHGHILIESIPSYGTIVRMLFPEHKPQQKIAAKRPNQPSQQIGHGKSILIIENDESIARLQSELLQSRGFITKVFSDTYQALDYFRAEPEKFDCIIIEQNMPSLSGLEFSEQALQLRPEVPIILCSNNEQTQETPPGIKEILTKPVSSKRLIDKVYKIFQTENKQGGKMPPKF